VAAPVGEGAAVPAGSIDLDLARRKLLPAQRRFIDRLEELR